MQLRILSPRHPLWRAGFRPFFTLAIFMGFLMPVIWGLVFFRKAGVTLRDKFHSVART